MNRKAWTTLAAISAAGLGGSAIAGAAQGTGSSSGSATGSSTANRTAPARPDETALTGETAEKVKAAALTKVKGTVLRVETDAGGVYEAHIRKSDGTEVEVKVDRAFAVTEVRELGRGGPRGGPGGARGGRGPGTGERALTGETAEKVRAAALVEVDGTVLRVETDRGGVYEAHVRKSDGTEVEVKVNKSFAVTAVEQHRAPRRP